MEYGVRLVGWDSKIGIRYEICEKIRLKKKFHFVVEVGCMWWNLISFFLQFSSFFPFSSFALLIYFHWRHSLDIFLSFFTIFFSHLLVRSTVLYYKYSSKCVMLPCFQHYRQEHFATVRVFKKRSFFWPTFTHNIFNILFMYGTIFISKNVQNRLYTNPDRDYWTSIRDIKWSVRIFFGREVGSSPIIYWNVQVINLRK